MAHEHHHTHEISKLNKAFIIGITLNLLFVIVEAGSGLYFGSLALLSDAGHNLSDVVSLILAMLAFRLAKIKPSKRYYIISGGRYHHFRKYIKITKPRSDKR